MDAECAAVLSLYTHYDNSTAEETASDLPASMVIGSALEQTASSTTTTAAAAVPSVLAASSVAASQMQILLPALSTTDVYRRIQGSSSVLVAADSPANRNIGIFREDGAEKETIVAGRDQDRNETSDAISFPFQQITAGDGGDLDSPLVPMPESRNHQNGVFFGGGWGNIPDHASTTKEGVSYSQECTEVRNGVWLADWSTC